MQFEDMTWMDVEHYLKDHDDRVVLITGACEQHAYLSLLSDIRAPLAIAQAAAQIEPVLIAPPLPYGISPYFTAYPGTVSLRPETFAAVVREVIGGLLAQGFRRVLVSNGHGGNTGTLVPLLIELGTAHPEVRLSLFEWWKHPRVTAAAGEAGLPQHHANWSEALPVNVVGPLPEGEKTPPRIAPATPAAETRRLLGDGSYGGPYQAPPAALDLLFGAAVAAMVESLRAL
ncbi:MAG: creatininase family protein [Anaerolineae bacterium]